MPAGAIPFPFGDCRVCNDHATGVHYGVATCEGCKGFFKRSLPKAFKYRCFHADQCAMNPMERNRCKSCRFRRCLDVGMSVDGVKMGRIPKVDKEKALEEHRRMSSYTSNPAGGLTDPIATPGSIPSRGMPKRRGPHAGRGHNALTRMGHDIPSHHPAIVPGGFQAKQEPFEEYGNYGGGGVSPLGDNTMQNTYRSSHSFPMGGIPLETWGSIDHSRRGVGAPSMNIVDQNINRGGSYGYGGGDACSPDYGESPVGSTSLSPSDYSFFVQAANSSVVDQAIAPRQLATGGFTLPTTASVPQMEDLTARKDYSTLGSGLTVKVGPCVPRSASLGTMVSAENSLSPLPASCRREMSPFNAPVIKELISQVIETGNGRELQHSLVKQFLSTTCVTSLVTNQNAGFKSSSTSCHSDHTDWMIPKTFTPDFSLPTRSRFVIGSDESLVSPIHRGSSLDDSVRLQMGSGDFIRQEMGSGGEDNISFRSNAGVQGGVEDMTSELQVSNAETMNNDMMIKSKVEAWFEDLRDCDNDPIRSPSASSACSSFVSDVVPRTNHVAGNVVATRSSSKERFRSSEKDGMGEMIKSETMEQDEEIEDIGESMYESTQGVSRVHMLTTEELLLQEQDQEEEEKRDDKGEKNMEVGGIDPFSEIPMTAKHVADVHRFELPLGTVPMLEFLIDSTSPSGKDPEWKDSLGGVDADDLKRREEIERVIACVTIVAERLMDIINIEKQITIDEEQGVRMIHKLNFAEATENVDDVREFWNEMMRVVPRNNTIIMGSRQ